MNKLLATGLIATALVLALAGPSAAQEIRMIASLTGGEETPGLLTGALGTAEVVIDSQRRSVTVTLNLFNLPTGTTAGHIHVGPKGVAGPVVLDFGFPAGRTGDMALVFGLGPRDFRPRPDIGINTIDDAIQAIVGGNAYVNVHTTSFPAGEIRGQILSR
ncbi:MAG: CHRD domain-containing protein [Vicinamibacterales bacterium]